MPENSQFVESFYSIVHNRLANILIFNVKQKFY